MVQYIPKYQLGTFFHGLLPTLFCSCIPHQRFFEMHSADHVAVIIPIIVAVYNCIHQQNEVRDVAPFYVALRKYQVGNLLHFHALPLVSVVTKLQLVLASCATGKLLSERSVQSIKNVVRQYVCDGVQSCLKQDRREYQRRKHLLD